MVRNKIKPLSFKDSGLDKKEWNVLKKLSNPKKVQDFLNSLLFNFEDRGETHDSVRKTLKKGKAHCFEGALIAATALWIRGHRPLLLDLVTVNSDLDHVVTLFKYDNCWGAISKTNHIVLRYREPVYKNIRELVMSYFHEYYLPNGLKTLRSFSEPFDLSKLGTKWITTEENLGGLAHRLDHSPHKRILSFKQEKNLRKVDKIEMKAGDITEW